MDNNLNWAENTEAVYRKGQSGLYFLRRLRSFTVCNLMLRMFYQSVVARSWGSRLRAADEGWGVPGVQLDSLVVVSERRILGKLHSILDNNTHPDLEQKHLQQHTHSLETRLCDSSESLV